MVNSNEVALANARKQRTNKVGMCQSVTRTWFDAPSAGDQDGDGDADAKDGWLSEPVSARVPGDRNPPKGAPLYFEKNGGKGFGHRAISTGDKSGTRSIDMSAGKYAPGKTGSATIEQIEKAMGVKYVGWSRTITGHAIPGLEKPKAPTKKPTPTPPKPTPPIAKPAKDELMVRVAHVSMQFSDSVRQKKADAEAIFKELTENHIWWVTGTEALETSTRQALKASATKYGWWIYFGSGTDTWAAVNLKVARKGSINGFTGPVVVPGRKGKNPAKKTVRVGFVNDDLGKFEIYPVHNLLSDTPEAQKKHMQAIGKDAEKWAAGPALGFMGADGNVQDKDHDATFGNGFITCWDELKKYPSTGHGTIDYICRWTDDKRVRLFNAVSRGDKSFPLHVDHFPVFAAYVVKKLK